MSASRKRFGRRKEDTEADTVARRERAQARTQRADSFLIGVRGAGLEARRRLRPVGRGIRAFLARIAPPITGALFAVARALGLALLGLVGLGTAAVRWTGQSIVPFLTRLAGAAAVRITPVNTLAVVAGVAAVTLGISQFLDYHGVAVGAPAYQGPISTVAPVPMTDLETTGSAHLYAMLPVALAALVLIALTAAGNWKLGRIVAALGLLGLLVSVAIDTPQGLDAGTAGSAFAGADPELLKGFWIQVTSSAVLAVCGLLLGSHVRAEVEGSPGAQDENGRLAGDGALSDGHPVSSRGAFPGWGARA
jgi:hypothetical protein